MYQISVLSGPNLIDVTMSGMLSVAETDAYIAELKAAFLTDRVRAGYRLLLDVSECQIQTQDMVKAMGAHMVQMPKAAAIAVVAASSLARMQVRRLFTQPYARVVATRAEARAWLLDGLEPSADRAAPARA